MTTTGVLDKNEDFAVTSIMPRNDFITIFTSRPYFSALVQGSFFL